MQGKEELEGLLIRVLKERNCLKRRVPILIKVAPDLTEDEKKSIADVATRDPVSMFYTWESIHGF